MTAPLDHVLEALRRIHHDVDRDARRLETVHAERLRCARGCNDCCVDGITVFAIEAERIRRERPDVLENEAAHPEGACAFLSGDGACRVYEQRPYVCRTQGLPLRWFDEAGAGEWVELRDICPLNDDPGEPLEEIPAADCWTLGAAESRLAELQESSSGGLQRTALRSLFGSSSR